MSIRNQLNALQPQFTISRYLMERNIAPIFFDFFFLTIMSCRLERFVKRGISLFPPLNYVSNAFLKIVIDFY